MLQTGSIRPQRARDLYPCEADASEAQDHHRPSGRFGDGGCDGIIGRIDVRSPIRVVDMHGCRKVEAGVRIEYLVVRALLYEKLSCIIMVAAQYLQNRSILAVLKYGAIQKNRNSGYIGRWTAECIYSEFEH